jgi:hypothetical protein
MAWAWACLSCNRTWDKTSPAAHKCDEPVELLEQLRGFWIAILRWSPMLRGKDEEQIRKLVMRPINRALLAELRGPSWAPSGDDASKMPINAPRVVATP